MNTKLSAAGAGIGCIGDDGNQVNAVVSNDTVRLMVLRDGKETVLQEKVVSASKMLHLKMNVRNGKDISFFFSSNGNLYAPVNDKPVDGAFLPPWDRAVRAGLIVKGTGTAVFEKFEMRTE